MVILSIDKTLFTFNSLICMALINCKKCGCQMSDKSEACPICGMPVGADVNEYNKKLEAESTTPVETMPQQNNTMVSQGNQPADNVSENNPPATPPPPSQPKPEQPKKKKQNRIDYWHRGRSYCNSLGCSVFRNERQ